MSELSVHSFFAIAHHHFPSKALMAHSISDLIFLHLNQLDNCFYMNEFEMLFFNIEFYDFAFAFDLNTDFGIKRQLCPAFHKKKCKTYLSLFVHGFSISLENKTRL